MPLGISCESYTLRCCSHFLSFALFLPPWMVLWSFWLTRFRSWTRVSSRITVLFIHVHVNAVPQLVTSTTPKVTLQTPKVTREWYFHTYILTSHIKLPTTPRCTMQKKCTSQPQWLRNYAGRQIFVICSLLAWRITFELAIQLVKILLMRLQSDPLGSYMYMTL